MTDIKDIGAIDAVVNIWTEEALSHRPDWGDDFFAGKMKAKDSLMAGLTLEQMQDLGLYISIPRSEKETDHDFAEPGLFVINSDGQVQVVDISNNPFARPDLEVFVSGLEWIRAPENNYPIRGTLA